MCVLCICDRMVKLVTTLLFVIVRETPFKSPVSYFCAAHCSWTFMVTSISFACFILAFFDVYKVLFVIFCSKQILHIAVELFAGGIAEVCAKSGADVSKA